MALPRRLGFLLGCLIAVLVAGFMASTAILVAQLMASQGIRSHDDGIETNISEVLPPADIASGDRGNKVPPPADVASGDHSNASLGLQNPTLNMSDPYVAAHADLQALVQDQSSYGSWWGSNLWNWFKRRFARGGGSDVVIYRRGYSFIRKVFDSVSEVPESMSEMIQKVGNVIDGVKKIIRFVQWVIRAVQNARQALRGLLHAVLCGGDFGGCPVAGTRCIEDVPLLPMDAKGWCIAKGSMICLLGGTKPWMPLGCWTVVQQGSVCIMDQCKCGKGKTCAHMVQQAAPGHRLVNGRGAVELSQ